VVCKLIGSHIKTEVLVAFLTEIKSGSEVGLNYIQAELIAHRCDHLTLIALLKARDFIPSLERWWLSMLTPSKLTVSG
jgi:hypothetical protein